MLEDAWRGPDSASSKDDLDKILDLSSTRVPGARRGLSTHSWTISTRFWTSPRRASRTRGSVVQTHQAFLRSVGFRTDSSDVEINEREDVASEDSIFAGLSPALRVEVRDTRTLQFGLRGGGSAQLRLVCISSSRRMDLDKGVETGNFDEIEVPDSGPGFYARREEGDVALR